METLPKALADEIESLEELDARALKRKYPALLSDAGDCSASGILRSIVAAGVAERTVNDFCFCGHGSAEIDCCIFYHIGECGAMTYASIMVFGLL